MGTQADALALAHCVVQGKVAELGGLVKSLEQQLAYERVRPCSRLSCPVWACWGTCLHSG